MSRAGLQIQEQVRILGFGHAVAATTLSPALRFTQLFLAPALSLATQRRPNHGSTNAPPCVHQSTFGLIQTPDKLLPWILSFSRELEDCDAWFDHHWARYAPQEEPAAVDFCGKISKKDQSPCSCPHEFPSPCLEHSPPLVVPG